MKDPYKILEVKRKASKSDIKDAYRKKAKKLHPDKGGNADDFKELSEAYRILSNDKLRLTYDTTGGISATENEKLIRATSICVQTLDAFLMELGEDILKQNIFELLKKTFSKNIRDLVKANEDMANGREILFTLNTKVVCKKKTEYPDVFQTFIEERVKNLDGGILSNEEQIEIQKICIKIADMYSMRNVPGKYQSLSEFIQDCKRTERHYTENSVKY